MDEQNQPDERKERANNYYYDQMVRTGGKESADAVMRKIASAGGKASRGGTGFGTQKVNKNGLTGRQQAKLSGAKGGKSRRKK